MRRSIVAVLFVLCLLGAAVPAVAHSHHRHHHHHKHHHHSKSHDDSSGGQAAPDEGASPDAGVSPDTAPAVAGSEKLATFRITGFGKKDNTPRNSTTISFHCIHQEAGGTGTFSDPLTAATPGHAGSTENQKCTKFYIPGIKRYVVIEDSGASKFSQPHLDVWSGTTDNVEDCEGKITKTEQIIENPGPDHPVNPGPIATDGGCNI